MASDALNMKQEVVSLCDQISRYGTRSKDDVEQIKFIGLYKINERISSRFFKILEFSRKCRIMDYDVDSPKPGKDDEMLITLLRTNKEIQTYFKHTCQLLPNQTSGNLRIEVDCSTLAYYDWLTNVKQTDNNIGNAALHLGGLSGETDKTGSNKKVSYDVECKEADLSEMCQDWMSIPGWTADIVQTEEANELLEPEVIFKLSRIVINVNIIISFPVVHLLPDERCQEISKLHLESVVEGKEKNYLQKPKLLPKLNCIFCPKSQKESTKVYAEIRPLVRLYRKSSPSPTRQSKPEVEPFNWRKYVQNESKRPNIKFSTSTALYSPPKPSYDNIFRSDAFQSNIKENYSGFRAKSEFKERPYSRKYISLYH